MNFLTMEIKNKVLMKIECELNGSNEQLLKFFRYIKTNPTKYCDINFVEVEQ